MLLQGRFQAGLLYYNICLVPSLLAHKGNKPPQHCSSYTAVQLAQGLPTALKSAITSQKAAHHPRGEQDNTAKSIKHSSLVGGNWHLQWQNQVVVPQQLPEVLRNIFYYRHSWLSPKENSAAYSLSSNVDFITA